MDKRKKPTWVVPLMLLLAAVSVVNLYLTATDYGIIQAKRVVRMIRYSSWDRSAIGLLGNRGWQFMRFLNAVVPSTSPIVVPIGAEWFSQENVLQFFLMPRGIPSCSSGNMSGVEADIRACVGHPGYFVPSIGSFPAADALPQDKRLVPFPSVVGWYHGIYVPVEFAPPHDLLPPPTALRASRVAAIATMDFGLLTAVLLLGLLLTAAILGRRIDLGVASLAFPLGCGALTWCTFLVSLVRRGRLDFLSFALAFTALGGAALVAKNIPGVPKRASAPNLPSQRERIERPALAILFLLIVVLFSLSAAISVARAYSSFDEIANWALKGYAIADFNTVYAGSAWGGHGLAYPQNLAIFISLFRLADRDVLGFTKLAFPLFLASLSAGSAAFLMRRGLSPVVACLCVLCLIATPVLFLHSTIAFANLPFATYIVLGGVHLIEGVPSRSIRQLVMGNLLLGFAAWTRPEGVGFGALLILILIAVALVSRRFWLGVVIATAPYLVISTSWLGFGYSYIRSDEVGQTLGGLFGALSSGSINTASVSVLMRYAAEHFADVHTWGLTVAAALFLASLALATIRRRGSFESAASLVSGLLLIGLPLFMFYAASYTKSDFIGFLDASFQRAFFPGITLLLLGGLGHLPEGVDPPVPAA